MCVWVPRRHHLGDIITSLRTEPHSTATATRRWLRCIRIVCVCHLSRERCADTFAWAHNYSSKHMNTYTPNATGEQRQREREIEIDTIYCIVFCVAANNSTPPPLLLPSLSSLHLPLTLSHTKHLNKAQHSPCVCEYVVCCVLCCLCVVVVCVVYVNQPYRHVHTQTSARIRMHVTHAIQQPGTGVKETLGAHFVCRYRRYLVEPLLDDCNALRRM